jgi:hypothetical protein
METELADEIQRRSEATKGVRHALSHKKRRSGPGDVANSRCGIRQLIAGAGAMTKEKALADAEALALALGITSSEAMMATSRRRNCRRPRSSR